MGGEKELNCVTDVFKGDCDISVLAVFSLTSCMSVVTYANLLFLMIRKVLFEPLLFFSG